MADTNKNLADGLTVEYRHNAQLLIYRLTNSRRDTISKYIEVAIEHIHETNGQTLFVVIDVSHPDFGMSPYFRKRVEEVINALNKSDSDGYLAVALPKSIMNSLVSIFLNVNSYRYKEFKQRTFTDPKQAIAWMEARFEEEKTIVK